MLFTSNFRLLFPSFVKNSSLRILANQNLTFSFNRKGMNVFYHLCSKLENLTVLLDFYSFAVSTERVRVILSPLNHIDMKSLTTS